MVQTLSLIHISRAEDADPGPGLQSGDEALGQSGLVGVHPIHPDGREVVTGRSQTDGLSRHGHLGLELLRHGGVGRGLHGHRLDHRAAGEEHGHLVEDLWATPEHADSERAEHLVALSLIHI